MGLSPVCVLQPSLGTCSDQYLMTNLKRSILTCRFLLKKSDDNCLFIKIAEYSKVSEKLEE